MGKKNINNKYSNKNNFDDLMKGFILMCDRDREKNAVKDANNFLIPVLFFLFYFIIKNIFY